MTDDDELIDRALLGDPDAFGALVRRYQDRLFTSIVHVVGSRENAEDVVQDAFVQAFLKLPKFRRTSSFYTWLYRIAFNAAASHRRRRKGARESIDANRELFGHDLADPAGGPDDRLVRQEQVALIRAALASLSDEHRVVIVLREIDGCDYETIAEILEISVGTVRSRLHRARSLMREQLKAIRQAAD